MWGLNPQPWDEESYIPSKKPARLPKNILAWYFYSTSMLFTSSYICFCWSCLNKVFRIQSLNGKKKSWWTPRASCCRKWSEGQPPHQRLRPTSFQYPSGHLAAKPGGGRWCDFTWIHTDFRVWWDIRNFQWSLFQKIKPNKPSCKTQKAYI